MSSKLNKKYRVTGKLMEILEVIQEAKNAPGNFLWHVVDEVRHTYPIQITDFKIESDKVFIGVENKSTLFAVGQTVYMRLPSRDAVFKSKVHLLNDFEVVLSFPTEILACERRKNKRHPFHLSDEKTIHLRSEGRSVFLKTLDISETGASVFISKDLQTHFIKGTAVMVEALGDHKLNPPMPAMVVGQFAHSLKHANVVEEGFRLGVQLEGVFPEAILTKFLVRPSLYTIDEKRLVADTVFRDKVHEVMSSTLQNLQKKRTGKNFLKIDFDHADPDYIKLHIKLLCEVLCGVGTKVGWISEKTLDKLIYVAYLHDVYLFNHPKLAKIQTKQELERNQDLTAEEKKMVLDSPLYAAELARQDQQSYPDAVKILLQQRELPDGTGFPYGINGSQLTPLSCLFIFGHYFVDYMIDDPNWTLDAFLKAYQRVLKGTYFAKIFQTLNQ